MDSSAEWVMQLQQSVDWVPILRLTLAAVLGGIVGVERELTGHSAGLRTNILISTSSCLFTILSLQAFDGNPQNTARVAAQVVTGVGFLGAGAVIQTKKMVHGLTTAATIWMVAAVGMAAATDLYVLGIVTTIITTAVLVLLGPLSTWLAAKSVIYQQRHEKSYQRIIEQEKKKHEDHE